MMLEPDPKLRATASALLALPMLRRPRPWSVLWYAAADALRRGWALWQVSRAMGQGAPPCSPTPGSDLPPPSLSPQALLSLLCWLWHGLAHPAGWLQPPSPPATPPGSPPCSLLLHSSLSSSWDEDSVGWVRAEGAGAGGPGRSSRPGPRPKRISGEQDPSHKSSPRQALGRDRRLVGCSLAVNAASLPSPV